MDLGLLTILKISWKLQGARQEKAKKYASKKFRLTSNSSFPRSLTSHQTL